MARLLGRESVSSDVAALFELVKNGYDADANKVDIYFKNIKSDNKKEHIVIVEDDGHGMTSDDISNKWMVIGTDTKERNEFSKKGRRVVGNKGVGRFATEKLAHNVTLISQTKNLKEECKLEINWDKYEGNNITFNDVENTFESNQIKPNLIKSGTKVVLKNLRTKWNEAKIAKLQKAISTLVLPEQIQKIKGDLFDVEIHAEEFGEFKKTKIDSVLFDAAPYKVVATLAQNYTKCTPRIYKKGELVRQDAIEMKDKELDDKEKWTSFGKCKVSLYFFPERNKYEPWDEHYKKVLNMNRISRLIRDFNGVKIYRDGFWVRPYGDEGNDWLELEASRVQSFLKIGNSRLIGFVEITKEQNKKIIDTTTRERLDENVYFKSMKRFVQDVINELYHYRDEEFRRRREEITKQKHENVLEKEIEYLGSLIEEQPLPTPEKKEIKNSLKKISKTFQNFQEDHKEEVEMLEIAERAYRNLASLGISTAAVGHEISCLISRHEEIPESIKNKMNENKWNDEYIENEVECIKEFFKKLKHYWWFTGSFLKNVPEDSSEKKLIQKIKINSVLNDFKETFTEILTDAYDIKYKISPESLTVCMNESDFMSVVSNLLTNSIKNLEKVDGDKNKKIRMTFYRDPYNFKIKFSDSGTGIKDEHKNKIFRLFFTTNENGTGLGLPIIKEIVKQYDGKIELSANSELGNGATFIISIPWKKVGK